MSRKLQGASPKKVADPYADMVLGDGPDTLDLIKRAMVEAALEAVAENDRLGIPTPGTRNGKIVWRQPPSKR